MSNYDLPIRYYRFFPGDKPLGFTDQSVALDSGETALLLVDVYHAAEKPEAKELVNPTWDSVWWEIVDSKLVPLIQVAREMKLPIIYVTNSSPRIEILRSPFGSRLTNSLGFDPTIDFREKTVDPIEFDAGNPVQLCIPPQIAPEPGDYFIRKHTYSGFYETRLDSLLRNLGVKTLLIAGFVADCCVLFTMADAVFRGYTSILVRDCTLAAEHPHEVNSLAQTQRTIIWIESFLGPSTTTQEILNLCKADL
ncbi:MAG: cysteine hydrolase [Chloroflexi bacterium]|nr:MAG: cysteine hydrolase [Chloroflexota bacterium]